MAFVNEENMKQAEELAKALGIEVDELNNPNTILKNVEVLLKTFNAFDTANKNLEEEVADLTAKIENVQAELKTEQERIENIISVFGDDVESINAEAIEQIGDELLKCRDKAVELQSQIKEITKDLGDE